MKNKVSPLDLTNSTLEELMVRFSLQVTPVLAKKAAGDLNYWAAGQVTFLKSQGINPVTYETIRWADTPLKAARLVAQHLSQL